MCITECEMSASAYIRSIAGLTSHTAHLNTGARNTQMSRMWTGTFSMCKTQCMPPDVNISPG